MTVEQVPTNQPWRVETNGINVVPEGERNGRARDLFWIWFAANIGILGIPYGGVIMGFGLNLWQGILAGLAGSFLSFLVVGAFSIAGRDGGVPMFTLSRAVFGRWGNLLPNLVSWISMLGWECITMITAVLAMMSLLGFALHLGTVALALISLAVIGVLVVGISLLGQATLVIVQRWASYVFGAATLIACVILVTHTNWSALLSRPPGPWLTGVVPAISIIIAGSGLSWANAAADYSRYQARQVPAGRVLWSATLGATVPLLGLMIVGILLSSSHPGIGTAANPIAVLQSALPAWAAVPFLITAVAGVVVQTVLNLYSSGLNLLNLGVPVARYQTVVVDAVVMVAGTIYVVVIEQNFFGPFESFLTLLGVGLAAWAGIFLGDQLFLRRRLGGYTPTTLYGTEGHGSEGQGLTRAGWNLPAVAGWIVAVVLGLLLTTSPFFNGPLAKGIFAASSLELVVAFCVGGVIYIAWSLLALPRRAA